ncbi:DegT/DnrJ/EryC1/StrS family aminotransferase [Novosphingobium sp. MW5]|nr:DegT/DnrJ/EryC1/StrS family aminotransferase [Novosphingobium sp. MW5]
MDQSENKRFFPVSRPSLAGNELNYVTEAVRTGWISSLGKYVSRLEDEFAEYCGAEHGIAVSNGTVSLHLILAASGIGQGDEVIVPDLTFIACANAVLMAGATPVFCDIDPVTLTIDPNSAEACVTTRTKAIMPVHLYGHPAAMDEIMAVAAKYGLLVIEDAAEAHGANLDGRRVGGLGHCASFSFYANKNMTTGEGGIITTNNASLAARCRKLRDHAMAPERRYWHEEPGFNYRMTNLQAALGCAQFEQLEGFLKARRELFTGYSRRLSGMQGISLNRTRPNADNAFWMVCMEIEGISRDERDKLIERLKADGVDTRPYFYPMSMMPYLDEADTPVSHDVSARGLNLPSAADYTDDDLHYICEVITRHLKEGW